MRKNIWVIILIILLASLSVSIVYYTFSKNNNDNDEHTIKYKISNNLVTFPGKREAAFTITLTNETENATIFRVVYSTRENTVYGILYKPNTQQKQLPAILILPGALVTKEGEENRLQLFAQQGYVAFTIDQRMTGENKGSMNSLQNDYAAFLGKKQVTQYLLVDEALQAIEVLKKLDFVDNHNIIIAGESMGGRVAAIAAYNEPIIQALLLISSSGYHTLLQQDSAEKKFLLTIDPDNYIDKLNGRKIAVIHSTRDTTIPIQEAEITFNLAKEPKKFYSIDGCNHGYCAEMDETVEKALEWIEE